MLVIAYQVIFDLCLFFESENIYLRSLISSVTMSQFKKVNSKTHFEHHLYIVLFLTSFQKPFKGLILANGEQQEQ